VSPILVRPVREQFEHDRVIRVLQARYKRKYEVAINPGMEQNASVMAGELTMYPDLVLSSPERSRKVQATVEVETTESINTLEAMAQWGPFSRLRTAFFLYVPAHTIDPVRRLCAEHQITPTEIWTYHAVMDQVRFTMVHRTPETTKASEPRPVPAKLAAAPAKAKAAVKPAPTKKAPPAKPAKAAKTAKKGGAAKKAPRPVVARPRAAATKSSKKSPGKRPTTGKR
jgi:hypothetical protein